MLNDFMYNGYYPCYCYVKKDMYFTFSNHVGGLLFRWYRDNLGYQEVVEAEKLGGVSAYQLMEQKAPKGPSSVLILPHFLTEAEPMV